MRHQTTITAEQRRGIVEMARQGCNAKEIAEALVVPRSTASRIAKAHGITLPHAPSTVRVAPTPEEIRERCAEVQSQWTPAERARREREAAAMLPVYHARLMPGATSRSLVFEYVGGSQ